jgi:hypothetical protein
MSKLPPELLVYQDWFERSARFYPDWTLTAAAVYFQNPDAPRRLSDFSDAVRGLYLSLDNLTKAVQDKPAAIEVVWPNAAQAIKAMRVLAVKANDVLSDAMNLPHGSLSGSLGKPQGQRLLGRLKKIVAAYTNLISPLAAVGVPLARVASLESPMSLRSAIVRLASAQPAGSDLRRGLLAALQQKVSDIATPPSVVLAT